MLSFDEFLNVRILNERFYNLFKKAEKEKYKEEAYRLLQNAYVKVGGLKGTGFKSPDDMVENIPFWKLAVKNGKIVAGIFYKDKSGRKSVAVFTDKSQEGNEQLINIIKHDFDRSFTEVSDEAFGFVRKILGDDILLKYVVAPKKAKELLKEKDEDFIFDVPSNDSHIIKAPKFKDYYYQRKIGGHFHTKIMFGKHGNVIAEQNSIHEVITDFFDDFNYSS